MLNKVRTYLFEDFPYVQNFGSAMNYDAYWRARSQRDIEEERAMYDHKFALIASLIAPGSTVVDIGCGDGALLRHLRDHRSVTPVGVELSKRACAMARAAGIEVHQLDVSTDYASIPAADYIVVSEVLEHIPNPEEVLIGLRERFGRHLLIDIPNTGALNDRLRLAMGRFPKQWVFHAGEHIRFWTLADFLHLCPQIGYRVERYYGLRDPSYEVGVKLWRWYPRLFSRYILYVLQRSE